METKDGSLTTNYYDYLRNHTKKAWYKLPAEWLTRMVEKMKSDDSGAPTNEEKVDPFRLTKMQYSTAHIIGKSINCTVDKKTSVITIEETDQDPLISATMADSVRCRLQSFITDYRTQKARNDLAYMEQLFAEAREQYVKARQQYAAFSDTNQDLLLQSYRSKFNAYTQVYEQLQLSKAKVQERTPAFTVVQSASVPIKHINKSKLSVMVMAMFLGAALRVCILIWKKRREVFIIH